MRPVLVDTSVWRRFFAGSAQYSGLKDLLDEDGAVLVHPFILGELVMGGLSSREEDLFQRLPAAERLSDEDVLAMVKHRRLTRRGVGWIDAHLLASALASSAVLWSADKELAAAAAELDAGFRPVRS
jgi:predicted nucleic acid-binding protein